MKKLFRNTFCLLLAVSGLVACQEQEVEVFDTPSASFPGISVADRQIYTSYSDAYKAYNTAPKKNLPNLLYHLLQELLNIKQYAAIPNNVKIPTDWANAIF